MSDFNSIVMMGNLVRDPSSRAAGQTMVAEFTIANNSGRKGDPTIFKDCEIWGKLAETLMQYCNKGTKVIVHGNVVGKEWTAKDGTKKSKEVIRCAGFTMLGSTHGNQQQKQQYQHQSQYTAEDRPPAAFNPNQGEDPPF